MMTRLQNKLPSHVELHTYGKDDLTESVLNQTDFFVSTLPLQIPGADVLRTSPLITGSELQHILGKIDTYFHIRKDPGLVTPSGDTFLSALDRTHLLAREMADLLRHYQQFTVPAQATFAQVVHTLASAVTENEDDTALLFDAIIRRERLNSQIFLTRALPCSTAAPRLSTNPASIPVFPTVRPLRMTTSKASRQCCCSSCPKTNTARSIRTYWASSAVPWSAMTHFTRPSSATTQKKSAATCSGFSRPISSPPWAYKSTYCRSFLTYDRPMGTGWSSIPFRMRTY